MPSLDALADATNCMLVITQPDRPAGRGQKLKATPVKVRALELGLTVVEPERLREIEAVLREARPDVFVVASYGKIVPQAILDLARSAALNVHPSLLPLYRGATPLQSQIRDGVVESGVTIIWMDAGMDTGDVARQVHGTIGARETYGELHDRFAKLGAETLATALVELTVGTLPRVPQAERGIDDGQIAATLTRPLRAADAVIDWSAAPEVVVNKVRSLAPSPGARALLEEGGRPYKVLECRVATGAERALEGKDADGPIVPCGAGGAIVLTRLVPPDRRPMTGREFLQWRASASLPAEAR